MVKRRDEGAEREEDGGAEERAEDGLVKWQVQSIRVAKAVYA